MGLTIVEYEAPVGDRSLRSHLGSGLKMVFLKITFDTSYPTGGEVLGLASYGLTPANVSRVAFEPDSTYIFTYDRANDKVLVYSALGTEVVDTTDISTVVAYMKITGSVPVD